MIGKRRVKSSEILIQQLAAARIGFETKREQVISAKADLETGPDRGAPSAMIEISVSERVTLAIGVFTLRSGEHLDGTV